MKRTVLWACAIFNFLLAIFHLAFWKMFGWADELPHLSQINQGILQVLNLAIVYLLLFGAVATAMLAQRNQFGLGEKLLLNLFVGFYLCRAALEGPFFGWDGKAVVVILVCMAMALGYLWNSLEVKARVAG